MVRWLLATAAHKRLTAFDAHLVSSRTHEVRGSTELILLLVLPWEQCDAHHAWRQVMQAGDAGGRRLRLLLPRRA